MESRLIIGCLLCFVALVTMGQRRYELPAGKSSSDYHARKIYVKIGEEVDNQSLSRDLGKLPFPIAGSRSIGSQKLNSATQEVNKKSILYGLYQLELLPDDDVITRINELLAYPNVLYAEPVFKERLLYTPNDPAADPTAGQQGYLTVVKAYDAWDVNQADVSIIIAISDTGLDLDHEDLEGKLLSNGDGTFGYDFGDDDTNPDSDGSQHGALVGGIAGAHTDNGIGIAGVGFNARLVPLKVFPTTSTFTVNAYESIEYAANNGYDIINLSWGSPNSFSQANQDIINYAVTEKDLVVVAAAGNSNLDESFYPASYEHVLSVAATELNDTKSSFSTFNNNVDISAPGVSIYSTNNGNYSSGNGTSFASPIVAGVAALVRAQFPDLNAQQVMELIRVTADNHYPSNASSMEGKLGTGRVNAQAAVSAVGQKAARSGPATIYGKNNGKFYFGDSLFLDFTLTNFLDPITSGQLEVIGTDDELVFDNELLALETLQSATYTKYAGKIDESISPGSTINLRIRVSEGNFSDYRQFSLEIEPDNFLLANNSTELELAGNGEIVSSGNLEFDGDPYGSEFGLILSTNYDSVADNIPVVFGTSKNEDFSTELPIKPYHNSGASDYSFNIFRSTELGLKIEQSVMAWDSIDVGFIVSYRIINTSGQDLSNLKAGLFCNWDIGDREQNFATWNQVDATVTTDQSQYAGVKILTGKEVLHNALDLETANGNVEEFSGDFLDSLKHHYLAIDSLDSAGIAGVGNDVADVLGAAIDTLVDNASEVVTFLIASGNSQSDLDATHDQLEAAFSAFQSTPPFIIEDFSCAGGTTTIVPKAGSTFNFYSDALGNNLISNNDTLLFGPVQGDSVIYVANTDSSYLGPIRSIPVDFVGQTANFTFSPDTLFLGEGLDIVSFTDASFKPQNWNWDFGNGNQASSQNPTVVYTTTGTIPVTLKVVTIQGCEGQTTKNLTVLRKPETLGITATTLCAGEAFSASSAGGLVRVYAADTSALLYEGASVQTNALEQDTTFFISQVIDDLESDLELVEINVQRVLPSYIVQADLSNPLGHNVQVINTTSQSQQATWMIDSTTFSGDTVQLANWTGARIISLEVLDNNNCTGTIQNSYALAESPKPVVVIPETLCPGEEIIIAPANGQNFGFYDTPTLDSALFKGNSYTYVPVAKDTLWIVGLDNGNPGDTTQLLINPTLVDFDISADPEELYLDVASSAKFTLNEAFSSTQWYVNGQFFDGSSTPIISFTEEGTYDISVATVSAEGCSYRADTVYQVFNSTPVILDLTNEAMLRIYPVPAKGVLFVQSEEPMEAVFLYDVAGQIVMSSENKTNRYQLDVSSLSTGSYFIKAVSKSKVTTVRKFYKN